MRQVYLDNVEPGNEIYKMSFYSASEGYVAFRDWIGYTNDSGRTFTKRHITLSNVNYGSNSVNLTFGFTISGVKAFNQNTIIAYGDYGFVPAILHSVDGGNTFTLIHHSLYGVLQIGGGIKDMIFPENNLVGFAVEADRILKTTNGGLSWSVARTDPGAFFNNLEAVDNNNVFAFNGLNKLLKTTNAGIGWSAINLPASSGRMAYVHFRTASKGWLSMYDNNSNYFFYTTSNGGSSWTLQNNIEATPFACSKMKFIDDNTGFALSGQNTVYKTEDGGKSWEPLPRDNNFSHLNYSHNDLHFWNNNQFWAGGGHGFLEITTNGGGASLPTPYFRTDTTGVAATGKVNLLNYSRTGYSYQWFVNNALISSSYHANYTHEIFHTVDTIKLIVKNGVYSDTAIKYQHFYPPVIVSSFAPGIAGAGSIVTINGLNFTDVNSVRFGGVSAKNFTVVSSTTITATVGAGASGAVSVITPTGSGSLPGFTFLPAPTISAFAPLSAQAGTSVTITGTNFNNISSVKFGGINATSFIIVSPTTITAIVPSGPSGAISVTTPGGTASLAGFFSLPVITSFTPLQGTQGTIMTITGSSFSGTTNVSVGGVVVKSFTVNSAGTITAIIGAGSSGPVSITTSGGSSSLAGFTWNPPPAITSFTPATGPVGTMVTITGTGFHPVPANNIVYFGAVRATVTGGSSTSLAVTVPVGATFENISVTSNNLVGYSVQPFLVTFPGGGSITGSSFTASTVINTGSTNNGPTNILLSDLDNDGKTDLIVSRNTTTPGDGGVYLYRNTSTSSVVSFAAPINIPKTGDVEVATGDLDGDGKPDLAVITIIAIATFRNTSTPGTLSFAAGPTLPSDNSPRGICIGDVDGDGKADIATRHYPGYSTSIYRNTSEPGNIVFAERVNFTLEGSGNLLLTDIDGDNKPELVAAGSSSEGLLILKNNCTKGTISFGTALNFSDYSHGYIASGDIDGDGKTDIVSAIGSKSNTVVLRNTSSGGTISFAPQLNFDGGTGSAFAAISDLDGDGKLDIATSLSNYRLGVFKNISTSGNISLHPKVDFIGGDFAGFRKVALGDINGDGKYDAVVISEIDRAISILLNNVKAEPFVQSFTPTTGTGGTVVTITGNNFVGVKMVSFGGTAATSFQVNSSTSITAEVGAGGSGAVSVTNNIGTSALSEFVYGSPPVITSFSPVSGPYNSIVTISGNNFNSSPANNYVYFGNIRANVLSATSTKLTVTVPFGSMYEPIKVCTGGLTAYSAQPFILTYPGASDFKEDSFAPGFIKMGLAYINIGDIDGDGKPDIVSLGASSTLAISRNTSLAGNFSFGPYYNFAAATNPGRTTVDDIDGDGKPDLAVICGNNTLSILRNTSFPGALNFDSHKDFPLNFGTTPSPSEMIIRDLDADGKPDISITDYSNGVLYIYKNTGTQGNISMATKIDFLLGNYGTAISLADMDGDSKPEIIFSSRATQTFSILRNTSLPGNISFAPKVNFGTATGKAFTGDMDNDGRTDIIFIENNTLSVYRNTSTQGNISLAPKIDFPINSKSTGLIINDLDGDNKADIVVSDFDLNKGFVIKNNSTAGNISFSSSTEYELNAYPSLGPSIDMDSDGKADIINYHNTGYITILRNQVGGSGPVITSFSPVSAVADTTITITGTNFTGATALSFGGTPARSFEVISASTIKAIVGTGTSGNIVATTPGGIASIGGFKYGLSPTITSVSPLLATPGTPVTITGANFTGTSAVSFGGAMAASFNIVSPTMISAVVGTGSSGNVSLTTNTGTAAFPGFQFVLPPTITSFTPTHGGGNSTVTIYGTNFTGVTTVSFGDVPALSFTVVSPTVITAVVFWAASGNVGVTNPAGTATMGGFSYGSSPGISSFSPAAATTGMPVVINGSNLGIITGVQFGGVPASSFTITSPTTITAVVGSGASGNISLVHQYGVTDKTGFTFISGSDPVIASVEPLIGGTGSNITIRGKNFSGATAVSFGGTATASFTIVSDTTILAIPGSGSSGTVSVKKAGATADFPGFTFTSAPVVSSFSPVIAFPGEQVIITGSNFSPVASSNIVYFGNVQAAVTSASANSLTVTVPEGSSFSPLSVTVSGLTGYSGKPFLPTFSGSGELAYNAFPARTDLGSFVNPAGISLADLDGDGKPDLGIANQGTSSAATRYLTFYKNAGAPGTIAFSPRQTQAENSGPYRLAHADLNGDGKLDLLTSNSSEYGTLRVYPNNSSPGSIILGSEIPLPSPYGGARSPVTADFDGNGKLDIAYIYFGSIAVRKHNGSGSAISFGSPVYFSASDKAVALVAADVDSDGKTDLIAAGGSEYYNGFIQIFRNTSSDTVISFTSVVVRTGSPLRDVAAGDIDGDGKTDIVALNEGSGSVIVVRNKCTPGNLMFEQQAGLAAGYRPQSMTLSDIDGNGKPDIIAADGTNNTLSVLTNKSSPGSVLFDPQKYISVNCPARYVSAADMDGDGKPDIILSNELANSVSVLRNMQSSLAVIKVTLCANNGAAIASDISGTTYQWQQNSGIGFVNINDNNNHSGTTEATLQLLSIPGSWNNYEYRCIINGSQISQLYKLNVTPAVTASITITALSTTVTQGQSVLLTASTVNPGAAPLYQWQDSTNTHSWQNIANSAISSLNYTPALTGNKVRCIMTSNAACINPATVTSNVLTFTVNTVTAIDPVPASSYGIRLYPNPVNSIFTIDTLKLSDRWQSLEIKSLDGKDCLPAKTITNQTRVSMNVSVLASGLYLVIMRNKSGEAVYLKFIKQ